MLRHLTTYLAVIACAASVARAEPDNLIERIDALARPLVDGDYVVGMSVGVAIGDRVVFRGYGRMSADDPAVPDERTVYEIGSVSKTFTGVLLADASLRGDVKLDDPVAKHLPDSVKIPQRNGKSITLEHLSTHMSGLPRMPGNFTPVDPTNPYADYTPMRMFSFLASHELRRDPGESREYSNLGVGLLGHTLARIAGVSYEQLMIQRIAEPLGMKDTTIVLREDQKRRLAPPHGADGQPASNWDIPTFAGAGGIRSTTADVMCYLRATANADDAADDDPLAKAMRLALAERSKDAGGRMGLGWFIAGDGITRVHTGQTGGYHCYAAVIPSRRIAVFVITNTGNEFADGLGDRLVRLAFGNNPEPMNLDPVVDVPAETLERYTGVYALSPAFALTVTRDGDRLFVQATGQGKARVYPSTPTEFRYRVVDASITFIEADGGLPARLILHQNGRDMPAIRTADAPKRKPDEEKP